MGEAAGKRSIVIVDDNPNNLKILSSILNGAGYAVRSALSGTVALRAISVSRPDLVLLDVLMPEMDGFETCRRLKADAQTRDIPVIFVSALNEGDDKAAAFKAGAVDYLTKPFQQEEVLARVAAQLAAPHPVGHSTDAPGAPGDVRRGGRTNGKGQDHLLEQSLAAVAAAVSGRIEPMVGHERRVAQLAVALGADLGFSEQRLAGLRLAATIHDLGMVLVPVEILSRPKRLSDAEYAIVKTHAERGYTIMRGVEFPWPIAEMIRQHHERLDGSGYPRGLKDDAILPEARILAIADVVEAMVSPRPHRAAPGLERALDEIASGGGRLYDAAAADACVRRFREQSWTFPAAS